MVEFSVSPMRQLLTLEPGQTYTGYIVVANSQEASDVLHYRATVTPYSVSGENYEADFLAESDRTLMAKWITIDEPIGEIAVNGKKRLHYTIKVPESVPAGGQYAAIAVSSEVRQGQENKSNVKNVFEIASVLYAGVDGETIHKGEIIENSLPGFSTTNDIKATLLLKNDGNVHEVATTKITVKEVLTGNMILNSDNEYTDIIMPESTRYLTRRIDHLANLGIYEVTQAVDYLDAEDSVTQIVVIIPIWFMVLVAATLIVLFWTIKHLLFKKPHAKMESIKGQHNL